MKSLFLFLLCVLTLGNFAQAQRPVYIKTKSKIGKGLVWTQKKETFIICPYHVVDNLTTDDRVVVIGMKSMSSSSKNAEIVRSYEDYDLAILKIVEDKLPSNLWEKTNIQIPNNSEGILTYTEVDGSVSAIQVLIKTSGFEYITIEPIAGEQSLYKGLSGATLRYNGKVVGMLLSVNTDNGQGKVIKKEVIMGVTYSYFNSDLSLESITSAEKNEAFKDHVNSTILCLPFHGCQFSEKTQIKDSKSRTIVLKKLFAGENKNDLFQVIDLEKLNSSRIPMKTRQYIHRRIGAEKMFVQAEFNNGEKSQIIEVKAITTNKLGHGEGYEIKPTNKTQNFDIRVLVNPDFSFTPIVPVGTKILNYSFDNNGFFSENPENHGPYPLYKIKIPKSAKELYLKLTLEDGNIIGPLHYEFKNRDAVFLETAKAKIISSMNSGLINCYNVKPIPKEWTSYDNSDQLAKVLSEQKLKTRDIQLDLFNLSFKKNQKFPLIACASARPDNPKNPFNFIPITTSEWKAVSSIKSGTDRTNLDLVSVVNIPKDEKSSNFKWQEIYPTSITHVYLQLVFYDKSLSPIFKLDIKNFKKI
ncbi:hypothetical protein [Psychroserpens sp. SPM9]|uniref:hypothetical protein n=1 Tax=Psychroserpens sp. SPM9 TaxID=2975598 RepID=UPI0021A7217F|nr:hypothetical protein [Psychroserpens sp. SPM9]MDG5491193.1 hypothetical protein [Psychroserpens sp. SPM9]